MLCYQSRIEVLIWCNYKYYRYRFIFKTYCLFCLIGSVFTLPYDSVISSAFVWDTCIFWFCLLSLKMGFYELKPCHIFIFTFYYVDNCDSFLDSKEKNVTIMRVELYCWEIGFLSYFVSTLRLSCDYCSDEVNN